MDPRLLRLYSDELTHLREVGAEFAREFPKIAARLALDGMEVADPYVERLLEGFAFLAARVQLKLDAEQPRLIAHLLEAVYPNFLAPVPSMMIARLARRPDRPEPGARLHRAARQRAAARELARGQDTRCEFRTAHDGARCGRSRSVEAQCFSHAPDLPLARLPPAQRHEGRPAHPAAQRVAGCRSTSSASTVWRSTSRAGDDVAFRLHELVLGSAMGSWVGGDVVTAAERWRGADSVRAVGFGDDEALLPETLRGFSGHRLLQEWRRCRSACCSSRSATWPRAWPACDGDEVELVICCFARGCRARIAGGRRQPGAVLHAGDQPVPQAARPHRARPGRLGVPRGARPHAADGLRGAQPRQRGRPRHRRRSRSRTSCRCTRTGTNAPAQAYYARAARAAPAVAEAEAAGAALVLHRRGGLPLAGRRAARAVPRRHCASSR